MCPPVENVAPPRSLGLALALVAALGCATPEAPRTQPAPSRPQQAAPDPVVLSEQGERYLELAFLFDCAREYLPYPEGEGPPVPVRTPAERAKRTQELTDCRREVAGKYASLEIVRMMTRRTDGNAMSEGEMQGVAQYGEAYLDTYVEHLLEQERGREARVTPDLVGGSAVAPSDPDAGPDAVDESPPPL